MFLTLSIRNAFRLDNGAPLSVVLERRGAIIGRGGVDWQLPDPDRHISSRHCEIQYVDGHYELIDYSTNGTFLLGDAGRMHSPHRIASGDVFRIGRYEIAASLEPAAVAGAHFSLPRAVGSLPARPIGEAGSWHAPANDLGAGGHFHSSGGSLAQPAPVAVPQANSWPAPAPQPAPPLQASAAERDFVAALGVNPALLPAADSDVLARSGRLLRRLVAGLLVVLAGRGRARTQIGLPGTQLRFEGNNPLKFARNPEEALERLLVSAQSGYIEGETAVEHAFRDLETHQSAMLHATQAAFDALARRFSPEAIRASAGDCPPAELWVQYERAFHSASQGGFAEVFMAEFRAAYRQAAGTDG